MDKLTFGDDGMRPCKKTNRPRKKRGKKKMEHK